MDNKQLAVLLIGLKEQMNDARLGAIAKIIEECSIEVPPKWKHSDEEYVASRINVILGDIRDLEYQLEMQIEVLQE